MIARYAILCAGCGEEILVRLSVFPSEGVRFYFPCPKCEIPLTGHMRGDEDIESVRVTFDDSQRVPGDLRKDYPSTVTVAPNLPLNRKARHLMEVGGAPNAMLLHIAGDNIEKVVRRLSMFNDLRVFWPDAQRMYEYYLHEQWERFTDTGKKLFGPSFTDPGHAHGRESMAYRAITFTTLPVAPEPCGQMLREIVGHLETTFDLPKFRSFAAEAVQSGNLQREQRRIWDSLRLLMKTIDMWLLPGVLWEEAANPKMKLDELTLSSDEFHQLRDVYISCFEACCKGLMYVMAFINSASRGGPEKFIPSAPPQSTRALVRTFVQFGRLPNAEKIAYLYESPALGAGLMKLLNSRLRNSLGHNSVRHDLRTDFIVTDEGPVMSYFEFTVTVYRLNAAVQIIVNILHSIRMAETQPLAYPAQ